MISSLIIVLELGLFSLLLLLAFRVLSLNRSEPLVPAMSQELDKPRYRDSQVHNSAPTSPSRRQQPDKCELISQLHILACLQDRDCKQLGLELGSAHQAVREYSVCWLYGAACALSRPDSRDSDMLAVIVSQFASRKLGIKQPEALSVISTLTRHAAFLVCFRGGIEGAEFWKTHHFVPREKSLFEAVTSNTFV